MRNCSSFLQRERGKSHNRGEADGVGREFWTGPAKLIGNPQQKLSPLRLFFLSAFEQSRPGGYSSFILSLVIPKPRSCAQLGGYDPFPIRRARTQTCFHWNKAAPRRASIDSGPLAGLLHNAPHQPQWRRRRQLSFQSTETVNHDRQIGTPVSKMEGKENSFFYLRDSLITPARSRRGRITTPVLSSSDSLERTPPAPFRMNGSCGRKETKTILPNFLSLS